MISRRSNSNNNMISRRSNSKNRRRSNNNRRSNSKNKSIRNQHILEENGRPKDAMYCLNVLFNIGGELRDGSDFSCSRMPPTTISRGVCSSSKWHDPIHSCQKGHSSSGKGKL